MTAEKQRQFDFGSDCFRLVQHGEVSVQPACGLIDFHLQSVQTVFIQQFEPLSPDVFPGELPVSDIRSAQIMHRLLVEREPGVHLAPHGFPEIAFIQRGTLVPDDFRPVQQ